MNYVISLILLFSLLWNNSESHRILGIFPSNSRSNFLVFERLMKSLADKGHHVDVVSSFPQYDDYLNYFDVIIPPTHSSLFNNVTYDDIGKKIVPVLNQVNTERGNNVCHALADEKIQAIIRNPPKDMPYDAVITEILIANCFLSIGHVLNVPVIGVSTYARLPWIYDIAGNSDGFNFVPEEPYTTNHVDFWHRITSFVDSAYQKWYFYHATNPQNHMLAKYLGKKVPNLRELESNVALVITNAHAAVDGVRPVTPGVIEAGGMHVVEKYVAPLFWDIKDYLDESKNGAVYFNLGEDLIFQSLPQPIIDAIYKTFEKLAPVRVLMRVGNHNDLPPGLPSNVITVPWVQQLHVLQHENVRAFITHGGLLGLQEAFYTGVPIVGIPLGGDQFDNIDFCVKKRIGVRVDLHTMNEKNLLFALERVLKNSTIKDEMHKFSQRFADSQVHPLQRACYWIEYVIKHGANVLKSPMTELNWYQRSFLDVYTVFLLLFVMMVITTALSVIKFVKLVVSKCRRKPKSKKLL